MQTFVLPAPPSVNNLFANVKGKGRVKTRNYRIWRELAQWAIALDGVSARPIETMEGPVEVEIVLGRLRGDVDNRQKAILDILKKTHVLLDDKQVAKLSVLRTNGDPKEITVTVKPHER